MRLKCIAAGQKATFICLISLVFFLWISGCRSSEEAVNPVSGEKLEVEVSAMNGPYGGRVASVYMDNTSIYASSTANMGMGLYQYFPDKGMWKVLLPNEQVNSFIELKNGDLIVGSGMFLRSIDKGETWNRGNYDNPNNPRAINDFIQLEDGSVLAALNAGSNLVPCLLRSTDNGKSWSAYNRNLSSGNVYSITNHKGTLYAPSGTRVYVSKDNASSWQYLEPGPYDASFHLRCVLIDSQDSLYAGTYNDGLIKWNGSKWRYFYYAYQGIEAALLHKDKVFLGTQNGIYTGALGEPLTRLPILEQITKLQSEGSRIIAGTDSAGVWLSENDGQDWKQIGLPGNVIWMKRKSSQELYCYILNQDGYTASNKLVRSLDGGQTWKVIFNSYLTDFGITNELLVLHSDKDLYVSSDKGDSWQKIQNNVDDGIRYGSFLYTADEAGNLYSAIGDKLYKWSSVNSPWQQVGTAPDNGSIGSIRLTRSGKIVITNGGGVYLSGDGGSSWKLIRRSNSLTFLEHSNTSDYLFVFTENDGLYASADEGKSWNLLFKASQTSPEGFTPAGILVDSRNRIWLSGKTNFGTKSVVYLSENGRSFRQITNPFLNNQTFMQPIEIAPGQIAIPTQSGGIFKIQPF